MTISENLALRFEPRNWQVQALERWLSTMRGIISVVTGGGKTAFAFFCIVEFLKKYPEGQILIIVPTSALLDQWHIGLQEDLGLSEKSIACYSGVEKPRKSLTVNIFVINTAREHALKLAIDNPTFLIVDECHRAGSPVNARALRGVHEASLGLSATPKREFDTGFEDFLVPALGPIIFEYGYEQAYADDVISPFSLINVEVSLLPNEKAQYEKYSRRIAVEIGNNTGAIQQNEKLKRLLMLRASVASTAAMRVPVAAKLVDMNPGQRSLVFHERVDAATAILHILKERNHSATIYHSGIPPAIRRENLRLYRRGVFDVLVTCRALDEGFNVPETQVAIIASSTASSRQRIQRLGRVLRPAPGKKEALIYTVYATSLEQERLLKEASTLTEISSITWMRGFRQDYG